MTGEQRGVAIGMGAALATAAVVLGLGGAWIEWGASVEARLEGLAASLLAPAAALLFCIARLAKHRFVTPEDIHGSALSAGTARARLLQALLQNTLEQLALAVPVYLAAWLLLPGRLLGLVPAAALLFLLGRGLFYAGYAGGAPSRAYGFALTFYPTILLAGVTIAAALPRLLA